METNVGYHYIWSFNVVAANHTSYVCILTPYKMTFIDDDDFPIWDALDSSIDYIFMADIVLTFFCAYYDSENNLITNQI